jgi:hypothetical protein
MIVIKADLTSDGRVENCSAEVQGSAPAALGTAMCKQIEAQSGSAFLKQQAAKYRTIRTATSVSIDARQFTFDASRWGTLMQRRAGEIHSDAGGKPIRCVPISAVGPGPGPNFCSPFLPQLQRANNADAKVARIMRFDTAMYGVPR